MRGKRAKAYKKEMVQYHQTFGFREPYQVLVDTELLKEAARCTMDPAPAFERTLRGKVKPMITQCAMRHLYAMEHPLKNLIIDVAKTFERRKCNHHELDEPLSELECFESVLVRNGENKFHYCVAAHDPEIRSRMKEVPGTPSIVIHRSVMILEPMTDTSRFMRERMERGKFLLGVTDARSALKGEPAVKRKREEKEGGEGEEGGVGTEKKKKKVRGPKGVNPLAAKKKKPRPTTTTTTVEKKKDEGAEVKKRRKRKHGAAKGGEERGDGEAEGNSDA